MTTLDTPETHPITFVHPFTKPSADVVIKSADGIEFKVHKVILSEASPFFDDMFSLPQNSVKSTSIDGTSADGSLPVLDMTEDAHTINYLLHTIYPIADLTLPTLNEAAAVMGAAQKYQIEQALNSAQKQALTFAEHAPVRVYALACFYKNAEVAQAAARFALRKSSPGQYVKELDLISATSYHRLLQYQSDARSKISTFFSGFDWVPRAVPSIVNDRETSAQIVWDAALIPSWLACTACSYARDAQGNLIYYNNQQHIVQMWWWNYMKAVEAAVQEQGPLGTCATSPSLVAGAVQAAMNSRCICSRKESIEAFFAFTKYLANKIDETVASEVGPSQTTPTVRN
jgi:hypothetical protein